MSIGKKVIIFQFLVFLKRKTSKILRGKIQKFAFRALIMKHYWYYNNRYTHVEIKNRGEARLINYQFWTHCTSASDAPCSSIMQYITYVFLTASRFLVQRGPTVNFYFFSRKKYWNRSLIYSYSNVFLILIYNFFFLSKYFEKFWYFKKWI